MSKRNPKEKLVCHAWLIERLHYDPATGFFTRKVAAGGRQVGERVGSDHSGGYRTVELQCDGKRCVFLEHRLAWFYMTGKWPKELVDHKNTKRNDNTWDNLREATHAQNGGNRTTPVNNSTGVTGVFYCRSTDRWRAMLRRKGVVVLNRTCPDYETAVAARRKAEKKYFGKYAPKSGENR